MHNNIMIKPDVIISVNPPVFPSNNGFYTIGSLIDTDEQVIEQIYHIHGISNAPDKTEHYLYLTVLNNVIVHIADSLSESTTEKYTVNDKIKLFIEVIDKHDTINSIKHWHDTLINHTIPDLEQIITKDPEITRIEIMDKCYLKVGTLVSSNIGYRLSHPIDFISPDQWYYNAILTDYFSVKNQPHELYGMCYAILAHLIITIHTFYSITLKCIDNEVREVWKPYIDTMEPWIEQSIALWKKLIGEVRTDMFNQCVTNIFKD